MTTWALRALCALCFSTLVFAQGTTSRVLGVVQDPSGASVAGAKVTLTNEGTGVEFTTTTSEVGAYVFEAVQVGSYSVAVEARGFKRFVSRNNQVTIGQPATVNVTLQVGELAQSVEVSGTAELVQTSTSGNFGNLMTGTQIRDLPIVGTRGRNPVNLALLQPGVVSGAFTGGGSYVFGARDRAWNYTLDGVDVNESSAGGSETTPTKMNPDSLAEFRVLTSNFTADAGRNSGGQVAMVTRSGTNEVHGTLFELYRTPRLHANEWENNVSGVGKRQFVQHTFGGSLGGPIIKNKTFFFVNGQGLRALETGLVTRTVYTAEARRGVLRYVRGGRNFPAGTANASVDDLGNVMPGLNIGVYNVVTSDPQRIGLDPTVQADIAKSPLPNTFTTGDGLNTAGFRFTSAQKEEQRDLTFKFDHTLNSKNYFFARLYFGKQDTNCDRVNGGEPVFPGQPCLVNTLRDPHNLAFNWRFNPTPRITNEFVFGKNYFKYDFASPSSFDNISFAGTPVSSVNQWYFGNARGITTWQVVDNAAYFTGAHALKFGINFRLQRHKDLRGSVAGLNVNQDVNFSTAINTVDPATFGLPADLNIANDRPNFQSHINYLLGRVGRTTKAFVSDGNQFVSALYNVTAHWNEYDFYIQDTWKVKKNLTVDLGLRWEVKMAPTTPDGRLARPDQVVSAAAPPSTTLKWVQGSLFNDAWRNFGPSVGFAWDPFGTGKTSIRSNYRIAFDRLNTFVVSSSILQNLPGSTIGVTNDEYGQRGGRLPGLPKLQPPSQKPADLRQPAPFSSNNITVMDPTFKTPTTHQWAVGVQRQIAPKTVLEVNYVGRRAYHLIGAYNVNQAEIFANNFVQAFNVVKAGGQSELINRMFSADSRIQAGRTASDMIRQQFASALDLNSVAAVAASLGTRIQGGRSVTDLSGAGPFPIIKYPQFSGGLNVIDSNDFSTYHGLVVQVQRQFSRGMSAQVSYTRSRALDTRSFDPTFTVVSTANNQQATSSPWNMYDRKLNYATADFDRPNAVQANWVYELPLGKGRRFASSPNPVIERLVGGWSINGIFSYFTGRPFTVFSGSNTYSSVVQTPANCGGCPRSMGEVFDDPRTGLKWYFNDTERAAFSTPAAGQFGDTTRNYFRRDRTLGLDAAFIKRTRITERFNLELRCDATNILNTPTFGFPTATITSATFGRIYNSVATTSRKMQLGAKLNF